MSCMCPDIPKGTILPSCPKEPKRPRKKKKAWKKKFKNMKLVKITPSFFTDKADSRIDETSQETWHRIVFPVEECCAIVNTKINEL